MVRTYNIDVDELNENSKTIQQPENIKIKLKPHQLSLLKNCIEFENNRIKLKNYSKIIDRYPGLQDNDYIKTLGSYANHYTGYGWFPLDYNMKPGKMYMLNSSYDGELVYPENESLARFENNESIPPLKTIRSSLFSIKSFIEQCGCSFGFVSK